MNRSLGRRSSDAGCGRHSCRSEGGDIWHSRDSQPLKVPDSNGQDDVPSAVDKGIHRFRIVVTAHVVHTLEHDAEPDPFPFRTECDGVCVFRNVGISYEGLVAVIDKSIAIHVAVFEIAGLYGAEC